MKKGKLTWGIQKINIVLHDNYGSGEGREVKERGQANVGDTKI